MYWYLRNDSFRIFICSTLLQPGKWKKRVICTKNMKYNVVYPYIRRVLLLLFLIAEALLICNRIHYFRQVSVFLKTII